MAKMENILLIDAGNTHLKICSVKNGMIESTNRFSYNEPWLDHFIDQYRNVPKVFSSVLSPPHTADLIQKLSPQFTLSPRTPLPLMLDYDTPETLGLDRICNACAMLHLSKTPISISIDIGTCIKFDVLEGKKYIGGSISPGIELRYRSLHEFTGKLPLVSERSSTHLTGKSTVQSIQSGVINGIQSELNGFIDAYQERYPALTFFISGGDAVHFDFEGKSGIFATENLTMLGMYTIYNFNAK
jgi:type III pantothenate kinase